MDPADQAHQIHMATSRLELLDAVVLAQDRFAEVSAAIAGSSDKHAARAAVGRLLGVREDMAARAVTELHWFRLTADDRRETRAERDEVIARLRAAGVEPTWSSAP